MKKVLSVLMVMILLFTGCTQGSTTKKSFKADLLKAVTTYKEDQIDALNGVIEVDGGEDEIITIDLEYSSEPTGVKYQLVQLKGDEVRTVTESDDTRLAFYANDLTPEWPTYLRVCDAKSNKIQAVKPINIRTHKSALQSEMPDDIGSEFGKGFVIDLSEKFPGAALEFLPFAIPVTVKTFSDGRTRIGLGVNSSDAKFWNNARQGKMPTSYSVSELMEIWESEESSWKGSSMGLIMIVSGWAEGKVGSDEPFKGALQAYIGTGWDINGQYGVLCWEVTVTVGATGEFDFSFVRDPDNDEYHFRTDSIQVGGVAGLELFGGVGLASIVGIGIYGAGSLALNTELYPSVEILSLIIAGETGFKAKLFGKTLFTFKIASGSYDFLDKNSLSNDAIINLSQDDKTISDLLLALDYASMAGTIHEPEGETVWYVHDISQPTLGIDSGWEKDRDFAHLLASNVYPDSHITVTRTKKGVLDSQITMVFIGDEKSRNAGNRGALMTSYILLDDDFVSDPVLVFDDGTADYDPYVYKDEARDNTYVVYRNAMTEITPEMTLAEVAANTEIFAADFWINSSWSWHKQVSHLQGTGTFAAGAKISVDQDGEPIIVYYTNDVNDPAGLTGVHDIYIATRDKTHEWHSEKELTIEGSIRDVDIAYFNGAVTISVSYKDKWDSYHTALYQNGNRIWIRDDAYSGRFVNSENPYFTYYSSRQFLYVDNNGNEGELTPKNIVIPTIEYDIYGTINGDQPLLIAYTASKDSREDAFALFKPVEANSFVKIPLTQLTSYALVEYLGITFSYDGNEPFVLYSVQNYEITYDPEDTNAANYLTTGAKGITNLKEGSTALVAGADDERFIDTQVDLYIKARNANRHVSLLDGEIIDPESARPGQFVYANITFKNNGLCDIDHVDFFCNDEAVGQYDGKLVPGQTETIKLTLMLPYYGLTRDPYEFVIEASALEDQSPETRLSVILPVGHLEGHLEHVFTDMKERVCYSIENMGFTEKDAVIIIQDTDTGEELFNKKITLRAGEVLKDSYAANDKLFAQGGHKNLSVCLKFEDGHEGDDSILENGFLKIVGLEEIYIQDMSPLMK